MRDLLVLLAAGAGLSLAGAIAPARAETIAVTREDCAKVAAHAPAPDVAYRPGVDARGNPVAPADLEGSPRLDLDAEGVAVDIEVPIRAFTGTPGDASAFTGAGGALDRFDATARIGVVTVEDGVVLFDGKPLSDPALERLAAACQKLRTSDASRP